jgi:spore coat protein A, manganese oxidase
MTLDRRQLLLAASFAAPWWRRASCGGDGAVVESRTAPPAPGPSGGLCVGTRGPASAASIEGPPRPPLHPDALARWVDPLPVPAVRTPDGLRPDPHDPGRSIPYHRIAMRESEVRVHRDVPPTRVWTYDGTLPGPTLEVRSGKGLLVEWRNELPAAHFLPVDHGLCGAGPDRPEVRTAVHVHGARVPPASDGYPEDWYGPGGSALHHYPNRQDAATLWYHDHAIGIERLNQYAGLMGMYLVRDDFEDGLGLPSGSREVPLVLFDRMFDAKGQLLYPTSGAPDAPWVSEFYGDALLVNGKLYPYLEVEPRQHRLRVVNASNSRFYLLSLFRSGATVPMHVIGTDQGLLAAPAPVDSFTLAPAERADLLVDFGPAAGESVVLRNQSFELLQFRVKSGTRRSSPVPARLRSATKVAESTVVKTRTLTLNQYRDPKTSGMLMLLNATRWAEAVSESPALDSVEIWRLVNLTEDVHPIHLHLVRFQIIDRQAFDADEYLISGAMNLRGDPAPPAPYEAGWKDTVRAEPGMITRIIVRFEGYAGRYVWHCHVLEHAANEMMRPFEVVG